MRQGRNRLVSMVTDKDKRLLLCHVSTTVLIFGVNATPSLSGDAVIKSPDLVGNYFGQSTFLAN